MRPIRILVLVPETFDPVEDLVDVREAAQAYINENWADDIERERADEYLDLLDYMDLARLEDRCYETVRRWRKIGKLPTPDKYKGNSPRWKLSTYQKWKAENAVPSDCQAP